MWLKLRWTVLFAAAALLTGSPAIADEDDDWDERRQRHKKKGKDKSKHKNHDPGYYVFYYVPRHTVPECPPPPPQDLSRRPDTAPMPQSQPRAHAKPPDAFPKESRQQRALAGERQREILEKELATEQDLLELAKRELDEQQVRIEREGGERSTLRPYIDNVDLYERNVAALRRELGQVHR
jgi:hypothetical protein